MPNIDFRGKEKNCSCGGVLVEVHCGERMECKASGNTLPIVLSVYCYLLKITKQFSKWSG